MDEPARPKLTRGQRLPVEAVERIRRLYVRGGMTQVELARRFGVTQGTISAIVRWRTWRVL